MSKEHTEKPVYQFPLTPEEAIDYLRSERKIIYHVASLRNLRRRGQAKSKGVKRRTTLWTKEELDAIRPTRRTRRVDEEASDQGSTGRGSTVLCKTRRMVA